MTLIDPTHPIRIARPSRSLDTAETFWRGGLGMEVLWRTGPEAEGGHALLMLGIQGASWHLELVDDTAALAANPPGPEDLLVVYLGRSATQDEIDKLVAAGGRVVPARNSYWDTYGITIEDPDGYLLVLSSRTWG